MIDRAHLRIIRALDDKGTLTEAANALCLTQPALSHQIRYLEKKLGVALWQRQGRKLRLTPAGDLLLQTARQVLPVLEQTEQTLKAYGEGRQGLLRIGVECYPCQTWLTRAIGRFLRARPEIDIDLVSQFQFSGLEGLLNHHIDILITPDRQQARNVIYQEVARYELRLVVSRRHPLAEREYANPDDLAGETLLTFPVPRNRLDILTGFLDPAHVEPAKIRAMESVDLMREMVSLNRGVCALPDWLARTETKRRHLKTLRLGAQGLRKTLFAAFREDDRGLPYRDAFIAGIVENG